MDLILENPPTLLKVQSLPAGFGPSCPVFPYRQAAQFAYVVVLVSNVFYHDWVDSTVSANVLLVQLWGSEWESVKGPLEPEALWCPVQYKTRTTVMQSKTAELESIQSRYKTLEKAE